MRPIPHHLFPVTPATTGNLPSSNPPHPPTPQKTKKEKTQSTTHPVETYKNVAVEKCLQKLSAKKGGRERKTSQTEIETEERKRSYPGSQPRT